MEDGFPKVIATLEHTLLGIVHARLHKIGQQIYWHQLTARANYSGFHRRVNVAVWVCPKQRPDRQIALKGYLTAIPCLIKQVRNDCVFTDVLGDVFFCIVRTHLLLVDVFLKYVAQHIWVNLGAGRQRPII